MAQWSYILAFLKKAGIWSLLIVIFAPIKMSMIFIGLLVLIDTITGAWAAKKLGKKVNSKSARLGLIPKAILYLLLLITCSIFESSSGVAAVYWGTFILMSIELWSIGENASKILGLPLLTFLKSLFNGKKGIIEALEKASKEKKDE